MPILSQNFGKNVMHHIKFVKGKDIGAVALALAMPHNSATIKPEMVIDGKNCH
jgi:hypothetical protein